MTLILTYPLSYGRGGRMLWVDHEVFPNLSPYDAAILLQLSRAGFAHTPLAGDSMNDDVSTALTLVSAPTTEPITLAQAKAFLRIEHAADDEAITRGITAARQYAEQYLRTALIAQIWDLKIANPNQCTLSLPLAPAQSITSVTASTLSGTSSTVPAANYRLSVDGRKVIFNPLPTTDILTIRYSAGLVATAADVPALIVQGMLHHVSVMMETRDGTAPLPMQAVNCYQPFRRISL